RTMILQDQVRSEQGGPLLPVPRGHRSLETVYPLPATSVREGLARGVARVELGVGGVEVLGVEQNHHCRLATLVDLVDCQHRDLDRSAPAVAAHPEPPMQRQSITSRGDQL